MMDKLRDLYFRILGYEEDGQWVAVVLEMDLCGYGPTWEAARQEAEDMAHCQISFALQKGEPDLIFRPAEAKYFEYYDQAQRELAHSRVSNAEPGMPRLFAGFLASEAARGDFGPDASSA